MVGRPARRATHNDLQGWREPGNGFSYAGVSLWTPLKDAGLITDRQYVEAIGSDGYAAIFSLGEIDPMFGNQPDLVAYADTGGELGPDGEDGFARIVVPGDVAGGRYISNLVALKVFTAAPVPEPATWVLLIGPLPILAFLRSRRRVFARGQAAR